MSYRQYGGAKYSASDLVAGPKDLEGKGRKLVHRKPGRMQGQPTGAVAGYVMEDGVRKWTIIKGVNPASMVALRTRARQVSEQNKARRAANPYAANVRKQRVPVSLKSARRLLHTYYRKMGTTRGLRRDMGHKSKPKLMLKPEGPRSYLYRGTGPGHYDMEGVDDAFTDYKKSASYRRLRKGRGAGTKVLAQKAPLKRKKPAKKRTTKASRSAAAKKAAATRARNKAAKQQGGYWF